MYVCICHAITDGDVLQAKGQGFNTQREVFEHFGVKPRCGRCLKCLKGIMTGDTSKIGQCAASR